MNKVINNVNDINKPYPSLCFVVTFHNEIEQLEPLLKSIRDVYGYKFVDIIVIWDGTHTDYNAVLTDGLYKDAHLFRYLYEKYNAYFIDGERLYTKETIHKWVRRLYSMYYNLSSADYMIKIDPDTGVHGTLSYFPDVDLFGDYKKLSMPFYPYEHVQGGCRVMRRSFVKTILESKLLDSLGNLPPVISYMNHDYTRQMHNEDQVTQHLIEMLGGSVSDHSEIHCMCKHEWVNQGKPTFDGFYAFTHPYYY